VAPELAAPELRSARGHLRALLARLLAETRASGREIAVDTLCTGLEAIPVPVLNTLLSKTVRRMLSGEGPGAGASLDDVIDMLDRMQTSDDEFERGLRDLRLDFGEIADDINAMRATLDAQAQSELGLMRPKVELRWPALDNRISALLANTGGGSVVVEEILLEVESWEPITIVDYSVPAAPLATLQLLVELTTKRTGYPLLELNGAEQRIFNERGGGAERVVVDASSAENVRYMIRLRLPFANLATGAAGELVHPPPASSPIELPFCCAPGWHEVNVEALHEPERIYADMRDTLGGLATILADRGDDDDVRRAAVERLRVPPFVLDPFFFTGFLLRFVVPFAQLARRVDRTGGLRVAGALLAAAPDEAVADDGVRDTLHAALATLE